MLEEYKAAVAVLGTSMPEALGRWSAVIEAVNAGRLVAPADIEAARAETRCTLSALTAITKAFAEMALTAELAVMRPHGEG